MLFKCIIFFLGEKMDELDENNKAYDNNRAYDHISLNEKLIEPEKKLKTKISRNLQLGYLKDPTQLNFLQNRAEFAILLDSIPEKKGGYITKFFAEIEHEKIDFYIVASNSVSGFGRRSQRASEIKQTVRDESERGWFSKFRN